MLYVTLSPVPDRTVFYAGRTRHYPPSPRSRYAVLSRGGVGLEWCFSGPWSDNQPVPWAKSFDVPRAMHLDGTGLTADEVGAITSATPRAGRELLAALVRAAKDTQAHLYPG